MGRREVEEDSFPVVLIQLRLEQQSLEQGVDGFGVGERKAGGEPGQAGGAHFGEAVCEQGAALGCVDL